MSITKRLLRWLDPKGEEQRMQMRHARCMVEANADDLVRTMATDRGRVLEQIEEYKRNAKPGGINGSAAHPPHGSDPS